MLTSYARLSASLAVVRPASSPSPSSLSAASSNRPMMKDLPDVGGNVIASTGTETERNREETDRLVLI